MNKKLIRLTESDLHRIIKESVNKVLNEDVFGKVGKSSSTFDSDNIPYDDDYIEKYGAGGQYFSNVDDEYYDDDYPYKGTNQSINKDTVAFLHRIENAVKNKFGGDCHIDYSMNKNAIDKERGGWFWNEEEYTDKIDFYWCDTNDFRGEGNDVFHFVLKFIKMKSEHEMNISNVKTDRVSCSITFETEPRLNDLGRNNKINISNRHGNPLKKFHNDDYRYGGERNKSKKY